MRFRGDLGYIGQSWAPQVPGTAVPESPGATSWDQLPLGWRTSGAPLYNPEQNISSNLPPITGPTVVGTFVPLHAANSHFSPSAGFPNPLRGSQAPNFNSFPQATCKSLAYQGLRGVLIA